MKITNSTSRRLPEGDLLNVGEVAGILGVSPRTFRDMVRRGRFPRPIELTNKTKRWPRAVVARTLGLESEVTG